MPKITIERETLGRALDALVYHQDQTRPIELTQVAIDGLRAALAAQPAPVAAPQPNDVQIDALVRFYGSLHMGTSHGSKTTFSFDERALGNFARAMIAAAGDKP